MNIWIKHVLTALSIFVVALVAGCGGGGGGGSSVPGASASTIIEGTAAAGAAIVGYVSVRDSSANPQPVITNVPIEANGHYSVDVSGLTAPFAFLASGTVGGKTVSLYSAATSADVGGTINITPFTDLMIRNIAATAVDTYIDSGGFSGLTAAELDAQRDALTAQLAPALAAMGLSDSIDLLRATFNADSTGLDRFMDVVKVDTTTPSAVTITNIMDAANQLIVDTTAHGTSSGTLGTGGMAASATPLDGILQTFKTFSGFFATNLPDPAAPELLALFSSNFMDDGESSSAFLTDITTDSTTVGLNFTNVVVDSIDDTGAIAQVHFRPLNASGASLADDQIGGAISWQMKKSASGVWQFDGNRRIAHVSVRTNAEKNTCNPSNAACTMTTFYRTGLHLEIDNRAMLGIGSAVVTGPGLPAGGVTLQAQADQTWLTIITTDANNAPSCADCTIGNNWTMADTEIAAVLPDSVYTVKLFDNAATPALLDTYTDVVPVAPVLNTGVSALAYPSIAGSSMTNMMGMMGTTLPLSWTIPSGLSGGQIGVHMSRTGVPGEDQSVWEDLSTRTGSGTSSLAITAPASGSWTDGTFWIDARDQYGGQVNTNYQ